MTIKLGEVIQLNGPLSMLLSAQFPAKISYKLLKMSKLVDEETKQYNETRTNTLKKYCKLDGEGNLKTNPDGLVIFKDNEGLAAANNEISELMNSEIDINIETIIPIDLIPDSLNIKPSDLSILLGKIIIEE